MPGAIAPGRRQCAARPALALALLLLTVAAAVAAPAWRQVEALFRDARYDDARRVAADLAASAPASPDALFWRMRLETEPAAVLATLRTGLARAELPAPLRARFALETAGIEYARGRYAPALEALEQVRRLRGAPLDGDAAVWAEAAGRALSRPAAERRPVAPAVAGRPPASVSPPRAATERAGDRAAPVAFALQLGAFTDETRARAFLIRWRSELPDLALVREQAADGAPFFKLRLGDWPDRAAAAAAARRLRRDAGLEAIVVEVPGRP